MNILDMNNIELDKMMQILSALVLGGVSGWYISYLFKAKFPVTVLTTLAVVTRNDDHSDAQ